MTAVAVLFHAKDNLSASRWPQDVIDLLCVMIREMTTSQLQNLRVRGFPILNAVMYSCNENLILCTLDSKVSVDDCGVPTAQGTLGLSAVQLACILDIGPIAFTKILKSSKNLAIRDSNGDGLLHMTASRDRSDDSVGKMTKSIKAGLDVNTRNNLRETPLHAAAQRRHLATLYFLLSQGSDPSFRDVQEILPIHWAVQNGHVRMMRSLSAYSAGLTQICDWECDLGIFSWGQKTTQRVSTIHIAAAEGHWKALKFLLEHPQSLSAEGVANQSASPLFFATCYGREAAVNLLLTTGAKATTGWQGMSLLHVAASKGHLNIAIALMNHGCDVGQVDHWGETALTCAIKSGHTLVANALRLREEETVLTKTSYLNTALGYAIDRNDLEGCKQFLASGASLSKSCSRETQFLPFMHALHRGFSPLASYFLSMGASCSGITPDHLQMHSYTALHYCLSLNDSELLNRVLDNCPGLLFVETDIHPMHLAIVSWSNHLLQILLSRSQECWDRSSGRELFSLHAGPSTEESRMPDVTINRRTQSRRMRLLESSSLVETRVQMRTSNWLTEGPDGNLQRYDGFSPLQCAAIVNNLEAAKLLRDHGASVECRPGLKGSSPLLHASGNNDSFVSWLLDNGASLYDYRWNCTSVITSIPKTIQPSLRKQFHSVAQHNWPADIHDRNMVSHLAAAYAPVGLIQLGFDSKSLAALDFFGYSAINYCFEHGAESVITYLLNTGADLSASTPAFGSVLNVVWLESHYSRLRRLLRRFGRETSTTLLNAKPQYRHTPLYYAAATGTCRILELLLASGSDADMVGGPVGSALMAAATFGRFEAVEILVDAGATTSYYSADDDATKSVLIQAKNFPQIQRWLLVGRFVRIKCLPR